MRSETNTTVTIIGGGVHGVHIATRLLQTGAVDPDNLCILDPEGLLDSLRRKCRQCGMETFRSPYVHHVGADPFSLREFARERGREDELRPSAVGANRPTVSLFFDHADWVCDRHNLADRHIDTRATAVDPRQSAVHIDTTHGSFSSKWCVHAVGHGGTTNRPTWAQNCASPAVTHVWEQSFDPESIDETAAVGVVGGGITAAQLATTLAELPGRTVTLFARSPFRVELREASTEWMHASGAVDQLHEHPAGSQARAEIVDRAHRDGSIPPHVFDRLRKAFDREQVALERSEIDTATDAGGTVVVTCEDGSAYCLDALVCATGFGLPYDGELLQSLAQRSTLQTGYRGAPVLDDDTLRWLRTDGPPSQVMVSGAAARQTLGPFAGNVIGARRAATLITDTIDAALDAANRSAPA